MTTTEKPPVHQRRRAFIDKLDRLARDLASGDKHLVGQARRSFAQLRRSVSGQRYEHEAMSLIFEFDPPREEEQIWLTIAGLFALNPQTSSAPLRLGAALRRLDQRRPGTTAQKRLRQLLAADANSLPQHLRSTLQLLASHDIVVDFRSLLDDAVTLLRPHRDEEQERNTRWRWARDFHRQENTNTTNNNDLSQENDE
ncbi:type I-E CRISPR-associated protein Cse2/CasB [Saccharopolyspora subtropica]|uniref:Type I-E CRISPR-associated protein Cse2/CasB n=1 Tax=Saccharopolyspora thermophila TaxID=89367 RepID=A0A917K3R0_9PSEU|nr:type I-E CRISPR-associated protein Cse2/CasB [Saccharopolyspora subtropica]GGI97883.1 type I-E CRISPR-associated protein Cse2/CasB [Saccharopolyspora subtropica]